MGRVVTAVAMTHNPRIFWNADGADIADRQAVEGAFAVARTAVEEARPDRVITVGNDHLDQFALTTTPSFAVGTSEHVVGPFWYEEAIMHLPGYRANGDRSLAEDILWGATESGIDVARCERFTVDHAFTVPLATVLPSQNIPVVPVFTNTFVPPLPKSCRYFELGATIKAVVASRPEQERIALVGSFNLSVDVGGPAMGKRHETFDQRVLQLIEAGDVDRLVNQLSPARLVAYGNSTAEFLNFHAVLGVLGEQRPDVVWYRLVEGWGGCPVVIWSSVDR